jgi:hypothetical protein
MKNKIDLLITSNGRKEYIVPTIESWKIFIDKYVKNKMIIDDSGNEDYRNWLAETFPDFKVLSLGTSNMGFSYLLKTWTTNLEFNSEYILLLEDDFFLLEDIDCDRMIQILENNNEMLELSLKRQAWSQEEIAAGGMIERIYTDSKFVQHDGWFKHKEFFTTNPSIININRLRKYAKLVYDTDELISEAEFGSRLFNNNPTMYCAFLGNIFDSHKVEHIGHIRTGVYQ